MIVFDDADFDRAIKDAAEGGFYNKGEACTATSRILVQDGIYDNFVEQLAAAVTKLKVGRGTSSSVHVGPVVTERPQLVVSGFGHLDVSALVRPLPRRVVRGSQMSAILAVPVPIEVMAMARAGGADGC
jgi:delta 1-pyrroline-5-carboxylate dehydrogenase